MEKIKIFVLALIVTLPLSSQNNSDSIDIAFGGLEFPKPDIETIDSFV